MSDKVDFTIERRTRSLITTCARTIKVDGRSRLSFEEYLLSGLKLFRTTEPGYENYPGVGAYLVLDLNYPNEGEIRVDNYPVSLEFIRKFENLSDKVRGNWYSVPGDELCYNLSDTGFVLCSLLLGSALSLIPWKNDNTFKLTMHGQQLSPGDYYIRLVDVFVFNNTLQSSEGPFRMLSEEFEYIITICDGYVQGRRSSKGRKAINVRQDKSHVKEIAKSLGRDIR